MRVCNWYYAIDATLSLTVVAVFITFLFDWEYYWIVMLFAAIPLLLLPMATLFLCDKNEIRNELSTEAHFQSTTIVTMLFPIAFFVLFIGVWPIWPFFFLAPLLFWPFAWWYIFIIPPPTVILPPRKPAKIEERAGLIEEQVPDLRW